MSNRALTWAMSQTAGSCTTKCILLVMADIANANSECYPSVAYLAEMAEADRKTVMKAIDTLEELGLVTDTGERVGRTGQVKVYRLNLEGIDEDGKNGTDTESGTVKGAQKGGVRVPNTIGKSPIVGTRIPHEPLGTSESAVALAPDGARPLLTTNEVWQKRLDDYDPHRLRETWKPFWGARPDAVGFGHLVPPGLLAAWREKRRAAA